MDMRTVLTKALGFFAAVMLFSGSAHAQENKSVVLQLEWEHEFQFAGYYAAVWQGFYEDAGLDVEIRSAFSADGEFFSSDAELLAGNAHFATGGLDAIMGRAQGHEYVVLSPIFQRSPVAIFSLASTDLETPEQVSRLRIAATGDPGTRVHIESMMFAAGIPANQTMFVNAEPSIETLIAGAADAIVTYEVSANYRAQELGVSLNTMRFDEHNVDFYGDVLYTTQNVIDSDPNIVTKFTEATLRGWQYALENPQEIADQISSELPRFVYEYADVQGYNRYFADRINSYLLYPTIPLGHNQMERWKYAYSLLEQQGLIGQPFFLQDLFLSQVDPELESESNFYWWLVLPLVVLCAIVALLRRSVFAAMMVAIPLLFLAAEQILENRYKLLLLDQERTQVSESLGDIRYQLESQLSNNLSLINGLSAFIASNPNYTQDAYDTYAAAIIEREGALVNLAAAPNLVISHIYPREGNEAALGLDYRNNAEQFPVIERLLETGSMVIAGPVNLVQGGSAFIGRAPVYVHSDDGEKVLWGIVSAPIAETTMYSRSNIFDPELGLDIAIRGRDGLGAEGEVFFGLPEVFENPRSVTMPVVLGGGTWQIGAVGYTDIIEGNVSLAIIRAVSFIAMCLTLIALYLRHRMLEGERRFEQLIFRNEQFLREVELVSKVGGWRLGSDGVFSEMSQQCLQILGLDSQSRDVSVDQVCDLFTADTADVLRGLMQNSLIYGDDFDTEILLKRIGGEGVWLHVRGEMVVLGSRRRELIGAIQNVTKEKEADKLIEYQANFDGLTGLANRSLFRDRLELALSQARRYSTKLAVLFIDLDNFKSVNDNLGHDVGDEVLIETSKRIGQCVGAADTVSRYSGDEFIVLLTNVLSEADVCRAVENIVASVAAPYSLRIHQIYCGVSIGIAFFPDDAEDSDTLIIKADQAMYEVKKSGRNGWQFYTDEMQLKSEKRHSLFNELVEALNAQELEVYYQPIMCPYKNAVVGCEALVRWQKADGQFVSPDEFISLAEESGLIIRIDYFVLCKAKQFVSQLNETYGLALSLSVNVSARLLYLRDESAQDWFNEIKKSSNVPISVEITERVLVEDANRARNVLEELNAAGVKISIDDFGTGYSSLSYLSRFPVQSMKIDRSFVCKIGQLRTEESLIETMLLMGEKLNISVVAEGVETQEQLDFLKNAHCDLVQGYFLGKPMPDNEFGDFVARSIES